MSGSQDESQLSFNIDRKPNGDDLVPDEPETPLQKLLEAHGINEAKLDETADALGSYSEAYRRLGISREELEALDRSETATDVEETPQVVYQPIEIETSPIVGPSKDLGERALDLTIALNELQDEAEELSEKLRAERDRKHPYKPLSQDEINKIRRRKSKSRQVHLAKADQAFHKAYGASAMVDAGEDPIEANFQEQMSANRFNERYAGIENQVNRKEFLKTLGRQVRKTDN